MAPLIEIVEVRLSIRPDGSIDRHGPFVVIAKDDTRNGIYVNEPKVVAQLAADEDRGRFEAIWKGRWRFGRRVSQFLKVS